MGGRVCVLVYVVGKTAKDILKKFFLPKFFYSSGNSTRVIGKNWSTLLSMRPTHTVKMWAWRPQYLSCSSWLERINWNWQEKQRRKMEREHAESKRFRYSCPSLSYSSTCEPINLLPRLAKLAQISFCRVPPGVQLIQCVKWKVLSSFTFFPRRYNDSSVTFTSNSPSAYAIPTILRMIFAFHGGWRSIYFIILKRRGLP